MQPPRGTAPSPGPVAEAPWGERLRQIRWTLRRWSPRHMVYRLRLPIRRRRWSRDRETLCRPFRKSDAARRTSGPALVFGEFSGTH
ncbi:MAG: hypothetical protein JWQ36_2672, partial [Enterovirga sp.]|nr:hypothetical protein [Enterovirga sp.]